ncbi:MAG: hypothetical protein IKC99_04365, partial [Clostridia bacterium]|nr:hypothetical protein [Clostridia bacterium]
ASPATTTTTTPPQTTTVSSVLEIRYETYMPSTKTPSATDERNADPLQEEPVLSDAMRFQNHIYGYKIYFPESWDGRINLGIDEYGNLTVNHRGMGEYSRGHLFDIVALELKYAPELREFSSGQRFVENNGIYLTRYMYFDSNQEYAICARFSNDPQYFLDGELNEETIIEKALNEEYFAMRNDLSEGRVVVVALPIYQS